MKHWVYKCNALDTPWPTYGDWDEVFALPRGRSWGDETLKGVGEVSAGDTLLAYQTDRNELVGTVLVVSTPKVKGLKRLVVRPLEEIRVKVRPLKASDARISGMWALAGGEIRTAYAITTSDARHLLARARLASQTKPSASASQKAEVVRALEELPPRERKECLRIMRVLVRSARLRSKVLRVWGSNACAACGLAMLDGSRNPECEIAHVQDVHAGGADLIANTIPLCRSHHWAFDRNLWAIEPSTLAIRVRADASKHLKRIDGNVIKRPPPVADIEPLAKKYLVWRWKRFQA